MINFVPNIVVLDYLINVNKSTQEIQINAKQFLDAGYRKQLSYKHDDGSFSVWGKKDDSGSTWLTAFVAKSFRQAAKYISVEADVIDEAFNFLAQTQSDDGRFVEVGYILQKDIQGGSSDGIALTAYTLITFLEHRISAETYKDTVDKALAFLSEHCNNITDSYSLAIATYALHLADHSLKNDSLSKLEAKAIREGGTMHWEKPTSASEIKTSNKATSLDIEMTAYALKAFVEAGRLADAVQIMKWLVSQRNENGGFVSSQDTVVGLQALSKVAAKMFSTNTDVDITIEHNGNEMYMPNVNERNALLLLKKKLPSAPAAARDFKITARGQGFSIFQISYQYNIDTPTEDTYRFDISREVNSTAERNTFRLTVCTNFIPDAESEKSNMAVMEVDFPSGFEFRKKFLNELKSTKEIKVCLFGVERSSIYSTHTDRYK